jgi:hypothetical protein
MAFKEVSTLDADVTVALGKRDKKTGKAYPTSAEGYYLGSRPVTNKKGQSNLHFLQTSKGNLGIWGTTDLDRKLSQTDPGVMVRITSTGTKPTPNGDMYTYKVEADKDNTIVVNMASSSSTEGSYGEDADDDLGSAYEDDDYEAPVAASTARSNKRSVEELLAGKKAKN